MRTIYNTTFIVNEEIETEWIEFMRRHYLPALQQQQLCDDILFTKVSIDQPEGKTYSLQMIFNSEERLQHFTDHFLAALEEQINCRYANQYLCFSSTLTEI